jgi:hypothetical protein
VNRDSFNLHHLLVDHRRRGLAAPVLVALVCSSFVLVLACTAERLLNYDANGHVYTIVELTRQIERDPGVWNGHDAWVRGRAVLDRPPRDPSDLPTHFMLVDADVPPSSLALNVVMGPEDPLLAALRRVPLLGALAPGAQSLQLKVTKVYHIQVRLPCPVTCARYVQAILLDAA